jgi:ribosomal protein S12 methylthiotransferase accessory factor
VDGHPAPPPVPSASLATDNGRAAPEGQPLTGRVLICGANPLSRAIARALREPAGAYSRQPEIIMTRHPEIDVAPAPATSSAADEEPDAPLDVGLPSVLPEVDAVVASCEAGLAEALFDLARMTRAEGIPFVPVWVEGLIGHVGPVVEPDGGPCLRCYLMRRAANDTGWEVTDAVRRATTEDPEGRRSHVALPALRGGLAELCAQEIRGLLSAAGTGESNGLPRDGASSGSGRRDRTVAGRALELNLIAFSAATRLVLPVPRCPECGGDRANSLSPPHAADRHTDEGQRLDELFNAWPLLVDPHVGVVREIEPLPVDDDEPAFVHYLSTASDTSVLTRLKNFGNNGGVSTTHPRAVAKALGEAVERYCASFFDYDDLTVAAYRDLPGRGTRPEDFALYSDAQLAMGTLPWTPFTSDVPVRWTTGTSLRTGEPVFVPAAMVFVPYHYLLDGRENGIVQPISTGLAAGTSFTDAVLSGLCEAVERDAFTIAWQARLQRPHVDEDSLPLSCRERIRRFTDVGLRVETMDITTDIGVPTLLTIAIGDRPTSPAVAVSAATHPDPETALVKSLEELAHTRKFARQVMDYAAPLPVDVEGGHPEVLEQQDHLRFYCPQEAKRFARFAWSSPRRRCLAEVGGMDGGTDEQLGAAVAALDAAGLEAVACDLTTSDIARAGLHVVRVVVPGLHPLFMGHRNRALGGRRLYQVPALLGETGIHPGEPDNPYPHPFP